MLWGKQAESLSEYLTKGKQIYVEGRLQTRQWDDKDGNKRYTTEIRGDRVVLLGGGGGGRGAADRSRRRHGRRTRASARTSRRAADRRRYSLLNVGQSLGNRLTAQSGLEPVLTTFIINDSAI